jgi:hypothetical protein
MATGLAFSFKGAATPLVGAEKFAEDPMLLAPAGVVGLFDSINGKSWPTQDNPTVPDNVYWINRAPKPTVKRLTLGGLSGTTNADYVSFVDGGFNVNSNAPPRPIWTSDSTAFNFTTESFLSTIWLKPIAQFFTKSGIQGLQGRWENSGESSWFQFWDGATLNCFIRGVPGGTEGVHYQYARFAATFAANKLTQIGVSVQISGGSLLIKGYQDGVKKVEATLPQASIYQTANARYFIGGSADQSFYSNAVYYRNYLENLSVSGNSPEARVAKDWQARIGVY